MDEIPIEYQKVALASTSFIKVANILESNYGSSNLQNCHLVVTTSDVLVELVDNKIIRIENLDIKNARKMLIYHEFSPLKRFIIILTKSKTVYLLCYETLNLINQWEDIEEIALKENVMKTGEPQLELRTTTGSSLLIEKEKFIVKGGEKSQAKLEAATALANRIKENVWHCQSLRQETQQKEIFAMKKINDLKNDLRGLQEQKPTSSVGQMNDTPNIRGGNSSNSILDISSVRQRIFNNIWIVCISLCNGSERFLINDPQLVMQCSGSNTLRYRVRLLKIYHLISGSSMSEIQIIPVDPPLLKYGKKAYLFGLCSLPDMINKSTTCQGLITYQVRNLSTNEDTFQHVPFPSVTLDLNNRRDLCLDLSKDQQLGSRIPLDLVALIAASVCHDVSITTLASPLQCVKEIILKHKEFRKVSNFYYIDSIATDPLHYCVFQWAPDSEGSNKLNLTLYARTDQHAALLAETIMQLLPKDCSMTPMKKCDTVENRQRLLNSKLNDTLALVLTKSSNVDCSLENSTYETGRAKLTAIRGGVQMSAKDYRQWRQSLHQLGNEIQYLYKI